MGVVVYEMLTGTLPFAASDPMELVHAHIARPPVPPHERSTDIPGPVSGIVMKLLFQSLLRPLLSNSEADLGR
jgi:serine/threonine protein kinase